MSKNIAVLDDNNNVINIILCEDDAQETANFVSYTDDNPATIGGDYVDGKFYPVKPFLSWTRNTKKGNWEPPVPMPTDGKIYNWNEDTKSWDEVAL